MNFDTIYGVAQTYLGVLATLIVLCLFLYQSEDNSNFILSLIRKVAYDFARHLSGIIRQLNAEIDTKYKSKTNDEALNNLLDENSTSMSAQKKDRLKQNLKGQMLLTQYFTRNVTAIQKKFERLEVLKDKEELPYIALLSLLLIITAMFVDCIGFISVEGRSLFLNILLGQSSFFIILLYHKYLFNKPMEKVEKPRRKLRFAIVLLSFIALPVVWLFISPAISTPEVAIGLLILFMALSCWAIKGKYIRFCHDHNRYNRSLILTHYAGFVTMSLILWTMITYWSELITAFGYPVYQVEYWRDIQSIISSQYVCYYFTLVFFSFNTLFGPLLAGIIFIKRQENGAIREVMECKDKAQEMLNELAEEYKRIVLKEN